MNTQKLIIAILLLAGITIQQCTTGCLRCNSKNQCLLCDVTNNFYLVGTTCQLNQQSNCLIFTQAGTCVSCVNNYYLDSNTKGCLQVAALSSVLNCIAYDSLQACVTCAPNFYISLGKCAAVKTTIPFCRMYSNDGVCSLCMPDYTRSATDNTCVALNANLNCLYYTFLRCDSCATGFIANANLYFNNWSNNDFISSNYLNQMIVRNQYWSPLQVCQLIVVRNCLVASAYNICSKCNLGYYLEAGLCIIYPSVSIRNCGVYSDAVTCTSCVDGFFLNLNLCTANIPIANCTVYSASAATTTCTACSPTYYVSGNICQLRVGSVTINNCLTKSLVLDQCATCNQGFILTSDGRGCFQEIPNCSAYAASVSSQTVFTCTLCKNGFYVATSGTGVTTCAAGTIGNCLTYAAAANTCLVCQNKFWLNGAVCTAHVDISSCLTYSQSVSNNCDLCVSGFHAFAYKQTCVSKTVLANCLGYNAAGTLCTSCAAGYYLDATPVCVAIPILFVNCKTFTGTTCTVCNKGYLKALTFANSNCTAVPDYITNHCTVPVVIAEGTDLNFDSTTAENLLCTYCGDYQRGFAVPFPFAICVNNNDLRLYSGYNPTLNCKRYGYATRGFGGNTDNGLNIVCMECAATYFLTGYSALAYLSTTQLGCSKTCDINALSSSAVIPDTYLGFVNICVTPSIVDSVANTILFHFKGACSRFIRYNWIGTISTPATFTVAQKENKDFVCMIAAPNSSVNEPINVVGIDSGISDLFTGTGAAAPVNLYGYYKPDKFTDVQVITSVDYIDFGGAYSNTVDASSILPTVFNYKGVLPYVTELNLGNNWKDSLFNNNIQNCDIYYRYGTTNLRLGYAFKTNVATGILTAATITVSKVICLRCSFGNQLTYKPTGVVGTNPVFPSCESMGTTCASATTVIGGLPTYLNTLFSCHQCASLSDNIKLYPWIWIEVDTVGAGGADLGSANGAFVGWSVKNVYSSLTAASANSGFKCAQRPTLKSVYTGNAAVLTDVVSCGAYGSLSLLATLGINANALNPTDQATASVTVCLACSANTVPTYVANAATPASAANLLTNWLDANNVPLYYISACVQGANCDVNATNMYNGCAKCLQDDFTTVPPTYYAFKEFTLAGCNTVNTENCMFSDGTAANSNCRVCKAGFVLNTNNKCESFRPPNMTNNVGTFYLSHFLRAASADFSVATNQRKLEFRYQSLLNVAQISPYGASTCNTGYSQFPVLKRTSNVCMWSSYIYNTTDTTGFVIPQCVRYSYNAAAVTCGKCDAGYIPTVNRLTCVAILSNAKLTDKCNLAENTVANGCNTCQGNYYAIAGVCTLGSIHNCEVYVNAGTMVCQTCNSGFSLSADGLTCSPGLVQNCKTYTAGSITSCTVCQDNFILLTLDTVFYCYPNPRWLNCATFATGSITGASVGELTCTACNQNATAAFVAVLWSDQVTTTLPQTPCLPFTVIPNCLRYSDRVIAVKPNTFACVECSNNYWYAATNFTCSPRFNVPTQCTAWNLLADLCITCGTGSYLSNGGRTCVNFPTGIPFCAIYSAATTCTACLDGYYLTNNSCLLSTVITNCLKYTANGVCGQCAAGFFLNNPTSCVTAVATNCLTYTNIKTCASCAVGSGLLLDASNNTNCVNNLNDLPNCLVATQVSPFQCTLCAPEYFINANFRCTQIPIQIPNCIKYDSGVTCLICANSTVLNLNRTACESIFYANQIDTNCQQASVLDQAACTQCNFGYYFSSGSCVACSANAYSSGCLSCDPNNNNLCLVCRPNYYMNAQGVCIQSVVISTNPTGQNGNPTNSGVISKALAVSLSFITLYFDRV